VRYSIPEVGGYKDRSSRVRGARTGSTLDSTGKYVKRQEASLVLSAKELLIEELPLTAAEATQNDPKTGVPQPEVTLEEVREFVNEQMGKLE
jgi:hypothetical protein